MTNETPASPGLISVLLADSKPIESTLLAASLRRQGFHVGICGSEAAEIMQFLENGEWDVIVNTLVPTASGLPDTAVLRTLHLTRPEIPKVLLMETQSRDLAVQAFRAGARGLLCLADSSLHSLCECIQRVHRGEIFATTEQLNYLLDSVCQGRYCGW